jgi:hypothetical protein
VYYFRDKLIVSNLVNLFPEYDCDWRVVLPILPFRLNRSVADPRVRSLDRLNAVAVGTGQEMERGRR